MNSGQAKKTVKYRIIARVAQAVVLLSVAVAALLTYRLVIDANQPPISEGEKLGNHYYRYQDSIYLRIPSQGYQILPQVDSGSFRSLDDFPLAEDKQAVYCGSQIISGLRPGSTFYISQGYISDGKLTYFCSSSTLNPKYRWWYQLMYGQSYDNPDWPRRYDYRLIPVSGALPGDLKTWGRGYLSDGRHLFYEGELLANSDGATVREVPWRDGDEDDLHPFYLQDERTVYYRGQPLPGVLPGHFLAFSPVGDQWQTDYGQDTLTGRFYAGATPFPERTRRRNSSNLQLLLANRDRANHDLFFNDKWLFYWDYASNQLKWVCENPLDPRYFQDELAPAVWADEQNTLVVRSRRLTLKNGGKRLTELILLPGIGRNTWRKLKNVKYAGTVWQAGDNFFLVPSLGNKHTFSDTLYQLKAPLVNIEHYSSLRKLRDLSEGHLSPVDEALGGEIVCRAESTNRYWF